MSNTQTDPGNTEQEDTANIASSQDSASGLNDATPTPPPDAQVRLRKNAEESDKLDNPERTNDSTIDPNKPKEDILKGFHGG